MIKQSIWFHLSTSARGAMYIDINRDMVRLWIVTFKRPRGVMDNASVWRARGPEIESHYGQEFFILKFSVVSRAAQRDNAIANEINRDIHLANTLF